MANFRQYFGRNHRRRPDSASEPQAPHPPWFQGYAVTSEDENFMRRMHGRTLVPTVVRLPSGRSITGDELREWFAARAPLHEPR